MGERQRPTWSEDGMSNVSLTANDTSMKSHYALSLGSLLLFHLLLPRSTEEMQKYIHDPSTR